MDKDKALEKKTYQANPLIESRRRWSVVETRLFFLGLCSTNPHISVNDKFYDDNLKEIFVPYSTLVELFGRYFFEISGEGGKKFKNICRDLLHKDIEITNGKDWKIYNVFSNIEYKHKHGLYMRFADDMRPFILDLISKQYTQITMREVWLLTSTYSIRLFELITQYKNTKRKERILTIAEIRDYLDIPADAYDGRSDNFRKKVIANPLKEINQKTRYKIDYEAIKEGRKIAAYKFTIIGEPTTDTEESPSPTPEEDMAWTLQQNGVHHALALVDKYGVACCRSNLDLAVKRMQESKRPIKDPAAYIARAIRQDWHSQEENGQQIIVGEKRREDEKHKEREEARQHRAARAKEEPGLQRIDVDAMLAARSPELYKELQAYRRQQAAKESNSEH